jgi:hypothetical protein
MNKYNIHLDDNGDFDPADFKASDLTNFATDGLGAAHAAAGVAIRTTALIFLQVLLQFIGFLRFEGFTGPAFGRTARRFKAFFRHLCLPRVKFGNDLVYIATNTAVSPLPPGQNSDEPQKTRAIRIRSPADVVYAYHLACVKVLPHKYQAGLGGAPGTLTYVRGGSDEAFRGPTNAVSPAMPFFFATSDEHADFNAFCAHYELAVVMPDWKPLLTFNTNVLAPSPQDSSGRP